MGRRRCGASKPCSLCSLKRFRRNRSRLGRERRGEERRLLHSPSGMAGTRALPAFSGIFTVMNLPGLPEEVSRPLSLPAGKKLTAEEIGPLTGRGASEAGIRCTASGDACRQWTLMELSPARWLQPLRPSACRSIFSTTMSWISPREAAYSSTFQGTLV